MAQRQQDFPEVKEDIRINQHTFKPGTYSDTECTGNATSRKSLSMTLSMAEEATTTTQGILLNHDQAKNERCKLNYSQVLKSRKETKETTTEVGHFGRRHKKNHRNKSVDTSILYLMIIILNFYVVCFLTTRFFYDKWSNHDREYNKTALIRPMGIKREQEEPAKPLLILHVGPPKTATTSIQVALKNITKELRLDNYVYVRKYVGSGYTEKVKLREKQQMKKLEKLEAVKQKRTGINVTKTVEKSFTDFSFDFERVEAEWKDNITVSGGWRHVHKLLEEAKNYSTNVIISAEEFCFERFPNKKHVWDKVLPTFQMFDVRVVITYRRYFEWLLSWYFRAVTNPFRQNYNLKIRTSNYMSIVDYFNMSLQEFRDLKATGDEYYLHPTQYAASKFGERFKEISVFNMHDIEQGDDLVSSFVCNMVPNATKTCDYLRTQHSEVSHANPSLDTDYYVISSFAHHYGHINMKEKYSLVYLAKKYLPRFKEKVGSYPLPYTCSSEKQIYEILDISLTFEQYIVPQWFSKDETRLHHIEKFMKAVKDKKFCDVDTKKMFEDKVWVDFFKKIGVEASEYVQSQIRKRADKRGAKTKKAMEERRAKFRSEMEAKKGKK